MLILWIIYVISVLFFMLSCASVNWCHVVTCWERTDLLAGSRLWCLIVKLSLSHWYPESDVVIDCIYSWSLPSFLLFLSTVITGGHSFLHTINMRSCHIWIKNWVLEFSKISAGKFFARGKNPRRDGEKSLQGNIFPAGILTFVEKYFLGHYRF